MQLSGLHSHHNQITNLVLEVLFKLCDLSGRQTYYTHFFFLSSLGNGNLVELRNFFISLGDKWQDVAKYLGFSAEEIQELVHPQPDNTEIQVM